MAKIKFLTDSAADIPQKYVDQYGIRVIPFPIALEDREILDGVDYSREEFYSLLTSLDKIPTHAQLNTFLFEEEYTAAWQEGYDALIYTCINFKGSNTGNNAIQAKDLFFKDHPEAEGKFEICVIDSKSYTYNYGYAVVQAAKRNQAENTTAADAVAQIQDWLVYHVRPEICPQIRPGFRCGGHHGRRHGHPSHYVFPRWRVQRVGQAPG